MRNDPMPAIALSQSVTCNRWQLQLLANWLSRDTSKPSKDRARRRHELIELLLQATGAKCLEAVTVDEDSRIADLVSTELEIVVTRPVMQSIVDFAWEAIEAKNDRGDAIVPGAAQEHFLSLAEMMEAALRGPKEE